MRAEAIFALYSDIISVDEEHGCFDRNGNIVNVDEILVSAKIAELEAAEPMRLLRIERNQLLQQTDWMALNDVVVSEEWKAYRQALRDLPANSEPQLDENGNLTNVTWPTKPGENT
jgi:hypothetical protein